MRHNMTPAQIMAHNRAILSRTDPCELARLDAMHDAHMRKHPDAQAWYDANIVGQPMNIPNEARSAGDEGSWPVGASVTRDTAKPRGPVSKPKEVEPAAKSRPCRFVRSKAPDELVAAVGAGRWRTLPRYR